MASLPSPGQLKMVSITTLPPSSVPMDSAVMVTMAGAALRSTSCSRISRQRTPRVRAPSTYSCPSCSRSSARNCRVNRLHRGMVSARQGSSNPLTLPLAITGSSFSRMQKKYISSTDSRKLGSELPIKLKNRTA